MLPKSQVNADITIWKGQHTPRKRVAYLFFQRYRVRSSIGDGDSTSKNEAAQSEKIAYG